MKHSGKWSILLLFVPLLLVAATQVIAGEGTWYLFARDDGCVPLQQLVRAENLKKAPVSPEDFAATLRARGEQVTVGLPEGFPPELAGKVVQVSYGYKAILFVAEEICRKGR